MGVHSLLRSASALVLAVGGVRGLRIIQSNDDGWAEMYLRSLHTTLVDARYDALVSAPAENESGTSKFTESYPNG